MFPQLAIKKKPARGAYVELHFYNALPNLSDRQNIYKTLVMRFVQRVCSHLYIYQNDMFLSQEQFPYCNGIAVPACDSCNTCACSFCLPFNTLSFSHQILSLTLINICLYQNVDIMRIHIFHHFINLADRAPVLSFAVVSERRIEHVHFLQPIGADTVGILLVVEFAAGLLQAAPLVR